MKLTYTKQPSKSLYSNILQLSELCHTYDKLTLSKPEPESGFVLLWEGQQLLSFISMCFSEDTICECVGYTHPQYRRQGYFSRCLDYVCKTLDEYDKTSGLQVELCFLTDHKSSSAMETLKALDAQLWYSEYIMNLLVDPDSYANEPEEGNTQISALSSEEYQIMVSGSNVGSFRLYRSAFHGFLHDFEILVSERGKGYAVSAIQNICALLDKEKIKELRLHVSSTNIPAVSLYKKTGFHITETLSYYLY